MSEFGIVEDTMFIPMLGRIYASEMHPDILIKRSDWNKKGRMERKRFFRSVMIMTGSARGRFQKPYGLAQPN